MSRARVVNGLRIALALLVLAAVAAAVVRNWTSVSADVRRIDARTFALAAGLVCLAPILTMLGWRILLADLGSPVHLAPAGGIFYVGQLGKYLPGSVWSIVAQAEMGARLDIPRRRSAVVGLMTLGIATVCGLIVGLPAVPLLISRNGDSSAAAWTLVPGLALLGFLMWPRLLNWGIRLGLRILRREPLEQELSGRAVLRSIVCFILAWLCSGLHILVLARATGAGHGGTSQLVVASVAGFALASTLAIFSVLLPAGVGVREGLLVLVLAPVTSVSAATAVVVVSRFLTVLSDVVFALLGWAWARSHHLITTRADRERGQVVVADETDG